MVVSFRLWMTPYYIAFLMESEGFALLYYIPDRILAIDIVIEVTVAIFVARKGQMTDLRNIIRCYCLWVLLDVIFLLPIYLLHRLPLASSQWNKYIGSKDMTSNSTQRQYQRISRRSVIWPLRATKTATVISITISMARIPSGI
ncbi:hypothetical protein QL285_046782 [Trifolium repens]|nr:hypothetical protein QL285_046782 [Trifolium repens]